MLSLNTIKLNNAQNRVSFGTDRITAENKRNDADFANATRKLREPSLVDGDINLFQYAMQRAQKILDAVKAVRESRNAECVECLPSVESTAFASKRKLSVLA